MQENLFQIVAHDTSRWKLYEYLQFRNELRHPQRDVTKNEERW